ncbi:HAMP domain-containing sensor histidine kinase [uncultured Dialister sp.]|uniref:sensor histidine kinase n=1 Tax=uncultured Dialister sp. TaxID=278064 RepID=UPI0027DCC4D3|nr:HAMP domain-containing sensor histidine kinase [uncultured Dialister sp.]
MTIRKSLILSHIAVCILPFLMTFFVLASAFGGLLLYAASGNHVMAESGFQFNVISQVIRATLFHGLRHREPLERYGWVMEITDPLSTYVALEKDGTTLYRYGNEKEGRQGIENLKAEGLPAKLDGREGNSSYSVTDGDDYRFMEKTIIHDETYHLYIMAHHPKFRNDGAIEKAARAVTRFILVVLGMFIVATSYFLSRFIIRRILAPLKELERGAEEVRKGNLAVQLGYDRNDEFTPAIETFNVMAWRLKQSLEEKEQDEERRKELIASISHDIRTPLTSIKAYVEGLLDHVASTPAMQERYLQVIRRKADVLERLVEQLLLLTKMDIGEKALPTESLDLSRVVSQFVEENRLNWGRNGADFHIEAKEAVKVEGNLLLLERVVENLVSNSIRYKTEERVHIDIEVKKRGGLAILTLSDDGPGVPEEALGRLKEAFFRTDKARSRTDKGSGLGLSIVARAVHLMKGRVTFSSRKPHGLKVDIVLPLEDIHEKTDTDCGR